MMSPERDPGLDRENGLVLAVVQALLGQITRNFIAVSVLVGPDTLLVNFWIREIEVGTDEEIDDIMAEVDVFMDNDPLGLESKVHIGEPPPFTPGQRERFVYWAKD